MLKFEAGRGGMRESERVWERERVCVSERERKMERGCRLEPIVIDHFRPYSGPCPTELNK